MHRALTFLAVLLFMGAVAFADSPTYGKKIGAPYTAPEEARSGYFYLGVLGAYDWRETTEADVNRWFAGLAGGYMLRSGAFAFGAELDAVRQWGGFGDLLGEGAADEIDRWRFSARLRAGTFLLPNLLAFGTAGPAWQAGDTALVWGGGLEMAASERVSLRAEILRYEFDDQATVARVGAFLKF